MTARDDTVEWMVDAAHEWRYGEIAAGVADDELVELSQVLLDAIPGDVLARLAIERGALVEVHRTEAWPTLYRLVTP